MCNHLLLCFLLLLPPEMWLWGRTGNDVQALRGGRLLSQLRTGPLFASQPLRGQEEGPCQLWDRDSRHTVWRLPARVRLQPAWPQGRCACPKLPCDGGFRVLPQQVWSLMGSLVDSPKDGGGGRTGRQTSNRMQPRARQQLPRRKETVATPAFPLLCWSPF